MCRARWHADVFEPIGLDPDDRCTSFALPTRLRPTPSKTCPAVGRLNDELERPRFLRSRGKGHQGTLVRPAGYA